TVGGQGPVEMVGVPGCERCLRGPMAGNLICSFRSEQNPRHYQHPFIKLMVIWGMHLRAMRL
ncbi:hypothetical protein, partial [Xanthomonas hortorum]